ncbi:hypothetical protein DFH06DRAFT_555563 [Mycena polygramma]|nr:hypothetical protein DFH06DRAFT_1259357 [Mycena polygramma]KAJ7649578.1 hypothetical protein DFH06DRAFT_555563 [Mycena polygramma]
MRFTLLASVVALASLSVLVLANTNTNAACAEHEDECDDSHPCCTGLACGPLDPDYPEGMHICYGQEDLLSSSLNANTNAHADDSCAEHGDECDDNHPCCMTLACGPLDPDHPEGMHICYGQGDVLSADGSGEAEQVPMKSEN